MVWDDQNFQLSNGGKQETNGKIFSSTAFISESLSSFKSKQNI
jgi:hypothetical protein